MDVELNLEGDDGQISVDNLHGALGELLDLLQEAADVAEVPRQTWRVSGLTAASAHVAMTAAEGNAVAGVVRRGIDALRERAAIPDGWTRKMVKRILDLGSRAGTGGANAVTVGFGDTNLRPRELDSTVTEHAERALGGASATYGSLRGVVKRWNESGRREIGINRESGPPIPASYPADLSSRIQAEAIGRDVEVWGVVRRNEAGQVVGMTIEDFRVLEPLSARGIASMVGVLKGDDAGALSLEDWLRDRHADD